MHRTNHNQVVERRRNGRQPGQSAMTILKQLPAVVVLERIPVPVLAIVQDATVLFANTAFQRWSAGLARKSCR
jgi:hypothetical protein